MADTGASVSIAGMKYARELGIREDDLLKSNLAVSSADGSKIGVFGSVLVELENAEYKTKEQVYICPCRGTRGCLLSLEACIALGLVSESFLEPMPLSKVMQGELRSDTDERKTKTTGSVGDVFSGAREVSETCSKPMKSKEDNQSSACCSRTE